MEDLPTIEEFLKLSNTNNDGNSDLNITTGLIIGKVKEKILEINEKNISINKDTLDLINKILDLSIERYDIDKFNDINDFNNENKITELYLYITSLTNKDIKEYFLSNETQKKDFIKLLKVFINTSIYDNIDDLFTDKIKVTELNRIKTEGGTYDKEELKLLEEKLINYYMKKSNR
ncbi:MAG: hypothetical protein Q9M94_06280 [Candidatus Gracilibacteria bacterium]|nr:hypothetical protein [Candidatus Gracilibacteria bacterium]MDQ7023441.1 hypothetical protein [Candidatus Gracilibacteria bacterium]